MRRLSITLAVLLSTAVVGQRAEAQAFTFSLFERYLDSFRIEAGIPGLSATILQNGIVRWERGFGRASVETGAPATPDTPYPLGTLSQIFGSTLFLRECVDEDSVELTDPVFWRTTGYPDTRTTVRDLLSHTSPSGGFAYAPERLSPLTETIERCAHRPYRPLLASEFLERFAMSYSAPDATLATPLPEDLLQFDGLHLQHYADVMRLMASPYRVVGGRPQRNADLVPHRGDMGDGMVSSVRDLARFDAALDANAILAPETRILSWTQTIVNGVPLPTGLGWFVQAYNGEPIVWQFGLIHGGYSSLIVKAPTRGLTLILLANSDGLNAAFALENGDVTTSLFAKLFLRFFVP